MSIFLLAITVLLARRLTSILFLTVAIMLTNILAFILLTTLYMYTFSIIIYTYFVDTSNHAFRYVDMRSGSRPRLASTFLLVETASLADVEL